jgi:hypothetical protein
MAGKKFNPSSTVPAPLEAAIKISAFKYNVPPDLLEGIWRIESGSHFPNPYVNSSGYGGLFGTTDWNGSTQSQADLAASILGKQLKIHNGDIAAALSSYSGGGYTSVPGQKTFGTWHGTPGVHYPGDPVTGGGLTGGGGILSGIHNPVSGVETAVEHAGEKVGKYILYGVAFVGGGILLLAGLILIGADVGISVFSQSKTFKPILNPASTILTHGRATVNSVKYRPSGKQSVRRSKDFVKSTPGPNQRRLKVVKEEIPF